MQNHNILIVDDDEMTQKLYEAYLKDPAFRLIKALSGKECFQQVQVNPVSLIILDIGIPDMDGYEIAAQLKMNSGTADIPIIFITGNTDSYLEAGKGYELGAVDFLTKPVDAKILRRKVLVLVKTYEKYRMMLTDLNTAKTTSRDLEDRLNAVLRAFPRAIFIMDKSGNIADCNDKAETLLLLKKNDIVGRTLSSFLTEQYRAGLTAALSSSASREFACAILRNKERETPAMAGMSAHGPVTLCEINPTQ